MTGRRTSGNGLMSPSLVVLALTVCCLDLQTSCAYTCEHTFSSQTTGSVGNFSSPGYPDSYAMNVNCRYVFQGTLNERINVSFLEFDLEPGAVAGCRFDYVDIFTIDLDRTKNLEDRLCGGSVPKPIISIHQTLELVFKSDYAGSNRGFFGTYRFIEETWQPFPQSTDGCGQAFVRGVGGEIRSPGYPDSFPPNSHCTWTIRGEDDTKIVLNFLAMNLGHSVHCGDTFVAIYNGFASIDGRPDAKVCKVRSKQEFKSKSFRVVLRFQTGSGTELLDDAGFRIVWTAVKISHEADIRPGAYVGEHSCQEFLCKGGEYCIDTSELLCNPLPRYCIAKSLRCNKVPNCGAYDQSDEEGCFSTALLVGGASAVSLLIFLLLTTSLVVFRKRKTYRAKKTEAAKKRDSDHDRKRKKKNKNQKQQRPAQQLNSLDRSPSTKRRCSSSTSLQPLGNSAAAAAATHLQYRYGGPPTSPPSTTAAVSVNYGATASSSYTCDEFGDVVVVVNPSVHASNERSAAIYRQNSLSSSTRSSSIRRIRSGTLEVAYQPLRPRGSFPSSPHSTTGVLPSSSYDAGGEAVRGVGGVLRLDGGGGEGRRLSGGGLKSLVGGGRTTYLVRYTEAASLSPGTSSTGDTDSYSYVDLDPGSRVVSAADVVSPVGMLGHSRRWNHSARFTTVTGYDAASSHRSSSYASSLV